MRYLHSTGTKIFNPNNASARNGTRLSCFDQPGWSSVLGTRTRPSLPWSPEWCRDISGTRSMKHLGRRSSCSESGRCSLRSSKCSPYIYIYVYIYIYIYGMVVSRGNYPLVICHIAIENGPNRNSWFTELFQMGGSFHRFLGLFTMSGSPKIGSLKMTSVNP